MTATLREAITAIQAGDPARGRQLLAQLLQQEPKNEAAWIWMSATVDDAEQRRYCLERVLAINPTNPTALAGVARLGAAQPHTPPLPIPLARQDHGLGQPDRPPETALPHTPAFVTHRQPISDADSPVVEETFIGDIVAAMNKDELGPPSLPDTDLNWLFPTGVVSDPAAQAPEQALRDIFSDLEQVTEQSDLSELRGEADMEGPAQASDLAALEPEISPAFELPEPAGGPELPPPPPPTPGQMWHNPAGGTGCLTILTDRYLITANPEPDRLAQIEAMLPEGQFSRRALGRRARSIPLERISLVRAAENSPVLEVTYRADNDSNTHKVVLAGPLLRDELLEALKGYLGAGFHSRMLKSSLWDRLFVPLLTLLMVVLTSGLLHFAALHLLADPQWQAGWLPAAVIGWLESGSASFLPLGVISLGGVLSIVCLVWLVSNLLKPWRTLVLERIGE